jgi:hypothetical protein
VFRRDDRRRAARYLELHLPTRRARRPQVFVEEAPGSWGFGDDMIGLAIEATTRAGGTVIESFALPAIAPPRTSSSVPG